MDEGKLVDHELGLLYGVGSSPRLSLVLPGLNKRNSLCFDGRLPRHWRILPTPLWPTPPRRPQSLQCPQLRHCTSVTLLSGSSQPKPRVRYTSTIVQEHPLKAPESSRLGLRRPTLTRIPSPTTMKCRLPSMSLGLCTRPALYGILRGLDHRTAGLGGRMGPA